MDDDGSDELARALGESKNRFVSGFPDRCDEIKARCLSVHAPRWTSASPPWRWVRRTINSVAAVLLEEVSFRRYPRLRDLLWLVSFGVLENFGYRQLTTWWRLRDIADFLRGKQAWGAMTRKGFQKT